MSDLGDLIDGEDSSFPVWAIIIIVIVVIIIGVIIALLIVRATNRQKARHQADARQRIKDRDLKRLRSPRPF